MARRSKSGIEVLASLPWPLVLVLGVVGFLAIRYGVPWWLSNHTGMLAQGFRQQSSAVFSPLAWLILAMCWLAALASYLGARQRHRLLDTRTNLESLASGGWRQFELLVGEAFRRQGFAVEETGLGGADGGIDLILRRNGQRTLVQCKQWRRKQVGVGVVREMAGLLTHHQAHSVKIACVGRYTADAQRFAQGKPIELIDGEQLLAMIQTVQHGATQPSTQARMEPTISTMSITAPSCGRCGSTTVQRTNRRNGKTFWGCSQFPRCRG